MEFMFNLLAVVVALVDPRLLAHQRVVVVPSPVRFPSLLVEMVDQVVTVEMSVSIPFPQSLFLPEAIPLRGSLFKALVAVVVMPVR